MLKRSLLLALVLLGGLVGSICFCRCDTRAEGIPFLDYGLNQIYFVEDCSSANSNSLDSEFSPNEVYNENATKIMTALIKAGYSKAEAAGVMGSLKGESGAFNPGEGENKYMGDIAENDRSFKVTDSPCYNKCGFGIVQWTSGGRQMKLQQYADSHNLSVVSLEAQIGYLIQELNEYGFGPGSFRFGAKADNAEAAGKAAIEVCSNYEIPGHSPAEARATCISRGSEAYGKAAFELMSSGSGGSGSGSSGGSSSGSGHSSGTFSNDSSEDGSNVTIIGDSITEGSKGEILKLLPKADIDSLVGRQFDEGVSILNKLVQDSKLRGTLVFALGTNGVGSANSNSIQQVIDAAGSGTKIVFVTNFTTANDYSSNNSSFSKAASNNANVSVADWERIVSANPNDYLSTDGIHPNPTGREEFAKLIYEAVSGNSRSNDGDSDDVCEPEDDSNSDCGGGNAIVEVAKELAWPDKNHYGQIKPEYAKAAREVGLSQYGVNLGDAQDCGKYVAVVVRKAVDKDFPACCTWTMEEYMANSSKWKEIANESSESNMKPGDVMVVNEGSYGYGSKQAPTGGQGAAGHVQIYIGGNEKLASASLNRRTGNTGEYFDFASKGIKYRIFRFIGATSNSNACNDGSLESLEEDLKKIEKEVGHEVGVAVAAIGTKKVSKAGSWSGGRAWSTIKVPLSIAAERFGDVSNGAVVDPYGGSCNYANNVAGAIEAAITKSDNCGAWWLWQSIGGDGTLAAGRVNTILRDGNDGNTNVVATGDGASLTSGKTMWLLSDQALFAANLASISNSSSVIKNMKSHKSSDKKAGLNSVFNKSASKGGWGSGNGAATRQFGIIKLSNDKCSGVAIGTNYYDSSFNVLTKIAKVLKDHESELPSDDCPRGI